MTRGGKGRVIDMAAMLARLVIAGGIGCLVFAASVALILADRASPALTGLAASLGVQGGGIAVAGFVAERVLHLARGRPAEPVVAAPPSWHNQVPRGGRQHSRPARVPARAPQVAEWSTVLGVPADAPCAMYEGAARSLLRQCHPDRWATAEPAQRQQAEARTRAILQALAEARRQSTRSSG